MLSIAVKELSRKVFLRGNVASSDWPGEKRLMQKVTNDKQRLKKAGTQNSLVHASNSKASTTNKSITTDDHSDRMLSDSAGYARNSSAHAPDANAATAKESIIMDEHLSSFNIQIRTAPMNAPSPTGYSESAANAPVANSPEVKDAQGGKIIPAKYGDEVKDLLMKDPHIQADVVVEHLQRKYCRDDTETSAWSGDKRLNQKVHNTRRRMKEGGFI